MSFVLEKEKPLAHQEDKVEVFVMIMVQLKI
jgi:hypothetical protein